METDVSDPRKSIFDAIRTARAKGFTPQEVARIDAFLTAIAVPSLAVPAAPSDPAWTKAGLTKLGEKEIPGPKHNSWIMSIYKGTIWEKFMTTDDNLHPWCGSFQKWCMQQAGVSYPRDFVRAAAWSTWGIALSRPIVGCIGVKARAGGNHVFQIIGVTSDGLRYKVLEGNASNMVRIGDIAVKDVTAIRWPSEVPLPAPRPLPVMPVGVISSSEQ